MCADEACDGWNILCFLVYSSLSHLCVFFICCTNIIQQIEKNRAERNERNSTNKNKPENHIEYMRVPLRQIDIVSPPPPPSPIPCDWLCDPIAIHCPLVHMVPQWSTAFI